MSTGSFSDITPADFAEAGVIGVECTGVSAFACDGVIWRGGRLRFYTATTVPAWYVKPRFPINTCLRTAIRCLANAHHRLDRETWEISKSVFRCAIIRMGVSGLEVPKQGL